MVSDNVAGKILPPFVVYKATNLWSTFVVYKATNLWSTWCVGDPKGARCFSTKSGLFDGVAFEEWFFSIVLPSFKKKLAIYNQVLESAVSIQGM